jgi:hypothetical protein
MTAVQTLAATIEIGGNLTSLLALLTLATSSVLITWLWRR